MTPAIGFILAALFTAAPITHNAASAQTPQIAEPIYECPPTYKLATRAGEVICLRHRRDFAR